jgi:hypothetical protein
VSERERKTDREERPTGEGVVPTAAESWQRHMRIRELIEQMRRVRTTPRPARRDVR